MTDDDAARRAANDATLAGIIAGRRRAAAALLVTDQGPAQEVRDGFAALRRDASDRRDDLPTPTEPTP